MRKLITTKLQKKHIAYALSAAIIISLTPSAAFAAEDNTSITTIASEDTTQSTVSTGGSITDGSQAGTSTGGSITDGSQTEPPAPENPSITSTPTEPATGGTITPGGNTPEESTSTPPSIGTYPVIPFPDTTPSATPGVTTTAPPVTDGSQGTVTTGGTINPGTTPGTSTGGAVTPDNSQTPAPSATPLAIGTKITVGKYIYRVNGTNTVALKGFAAGVSLSKVIARNQVTYKNITYKVTKIGDNAFNGQTGIKQVIIRKNITDISLKSFYNCTNLTKVTARTGVTIIRKKAFMGCSKLKTVNITSPVLAQVKKNAFKNIKSGAVINVVNNKAKLAVKASIPATVKVNQM